MRVPDQTVLLWTQLKAALSARAIPLRSAVAGRCVSWLHFVQIPRVLFFQQVQSRSRMGNLQPLLNYVSDLLGEDDEHSEESGNGRDPLSMIAFRLVRLLAILALLSLQVYELTENGNSVVAWSLLAFFVSGKYFAAV